MADNEQINEVPKIRTYERDVEEFMKKEGGTAADFALAEQERRIEKIETKPPLPIPPPGGGNKRVGLISNIPAIPSPHMELLRRNARLLVLWSIGFLFLAGAVGIGYWYISNLEPQTPAPVRVGTAKIILADKEKALDTSRLTRDTFITAFAREREAALALSSFTLITPTKPTQSATGEATVRALATGEFLALLETSARGDFARALAPEFALGIRGLPTNRAFLIFKTHFYQTALAGMLAWEETLLNDTGPLFGEAINETGPVETSDAFTSRVSRFTDRTINNRDVRELISSNGKPLLLYGFANKQTLIIADDEDTFEKTMEKLVATP